MKSKYRAWHRAAALVTVGFVTLSCTAYVVEPGSVRESIERGPDEVLIRTSGGGRFVVHHPVLHADSLKGTILQRDGRRRAPREFTIPLQDIVSVASQRLDGGKTAAVLIGAGGALLGLYVWALYRIDT